MLIRSLTSIKVTGVRKRELEVLFDKYLRGDLGVLGIVFGPFFANEGHSFHQSLRI